MNPGPAPVLVLPLPPFSQNPHGSPDSLLILELLLELDEGHVIVIKLRNAFCFFCIEVIVWMK